MSKVERKIPVMFQKLNDYDDRFMSVKIWLMHTGQNFNGSYFSKDVVQAAIPSLANTPILGYIIDDDGEPDFNEHKMVLSKNSKGRYELRYIGQAYGVIPETNNAQFETKVCDDGIEREFLTVEGLLWNKWDIPEEIMLRDLVKNQSMELDEDYEGYYDNNDKLFHFTKIKFFGACILGDDVSPAMKGADIEVNFSMQNDWQKEVQRNMEDFKALYTGYQSSTMDNDINAKDKEDGNMKDKLLTILANYSLTEEAVIEKGISLADFDSEESFEAKVKEVFALDTTDEQEPPAVVVVVANPDNDDAENGDGNEQEENEVNIVAVSFTEDQVKELQDNLADISNKYATLQAEKDELSTQFSTLESEVLELRQFKADKESQERQAQVEETFNQFAEQLSEDEMTLAREQFASLDVESLEKELFAMVGKKAAKFSKKATPTPTAKVPLFSKQEDPSTEGYAYIIEKAMKK